MKFNKSSATIGLILSQSISCVRAVHDGKPGSSPPKPLKITEWEGRSISKQAKFAHGLQVHAYTCNYNFINLLMPRIHDTKPNH